MTEKLDMGTVNKVKIVSWKHGYPTESFLPFTLADTGGLWCASCLRYIEHPTYFAIREISAYDIMVNKHHPIQNWWAGSKLPSLKYERIKKHKKSISDIYGIPVHRKCHKPLDNQSQALVYTLDTYVFDGLPKTALRLLHSGHAWAAFAACWHIINVVKPVDPNVDAEAKDILLQAASVAVGPWEPDTKMIVPRPGAQPGWEAVLAFRTAIHYAAHGFIDRARKYLTFGEDRIPSKLRMWWVDVLRLKTRAEVLRDLEAARIVALLTPSVSRRQCEAEIRSNRGLSAENNFAAIDEALAKADSPFWHFRARQEHFYGLLNLIKGEKEEAYMKLVRAQYIYCRLGLQFPLHAPLLQDEFSSVPGYALREISFSKSRERNRTKLFSLRIKAIKESGLLTQLRSEFDIRES